MTLSTVRPDWPVSSRVQVHATTRLGGVSAPPYHSLNLGLHVGDAAGAVLENRRRLNLGLDLPSAPHWLHQVHGADILPIDDRDTRPCNAGEQPGITADGSTTTLPLVVLAVMTADCLPVVLSDVMGQRIAVVHAGWRGLAAGILERAVEHFPMDSELHAWLGPAIGPQGFEVGEEVRQQFVDRDSRAGAAFVPGEGSGKFMADLYALAHASLNVRRPVSTVGGDCCTWSDRQRFHSHRRDGVHSGRQATLAWISAPANTGG